MTIKITQIKKDTILKTTDTTYLLIDLKTKKIQCPNGFIKNLNSSCNEFVSIDDVLKLVYPPDRIVFHNNYLRMLANEMIEEPLFVRLIGEKKQPLWFFYNAFLVCNEQQKPIEILISIRSVIETMYLYKVHKLINDGATGYYGYYDYDSNKLYFNDAFNKLLNLQDNDLGDLNAFLKRLNSDDVKQLMAMANDISVHSNGNDLLTCEFVLDVAGQPRNIKFNGKLERDINGNPSLLGGTLLDETEFKRTQLINHYMLNAPSGFPYVWDLIHDRLEFSERIIELLPLDFPVIEQAYQTWTSYILPEDLPHFLNSFEPARKGEKIHATEYRIIDKNGQPVWLAVRSRPIFDNNNNVTMIVGNIFDIASMGEYNHFIEAQTLYNKVTQAPNRSQCIIDLNKVLETPEQLGFIVLINIDDFGLVNNMFNHKTGDQLLCNLANLFRSRIDDSCQLYHFDSDVFLIHFPHYDLNKVVSFMQAIKETSSCGLNPEDIHFCFTISMVAVAYHSNHSHVDELLQDADMGMKKVKSTGKNKYIVFDDNDRLIYQQARALEIELVDAVATDCEGFEFYYQPLFSSDGRHCLGAEALLRFKNKEGQLISPDQFIPFLERSDLIVTVEAWGLKTIVAQVSQWIAFSGQDDFVININASINTLTEKNFRSRFIDTINNSKLEPKNIVLEVTESALIMDRQSGTTLLKLIQDFGVRIAIDDFGTGYSSLSYLKSLPVDEIKIDRSFIINVESDISELLFVNSIVQLIRSLNRIICIEGIETKKQFDYLRKLGVDFFQGFWFDKPLTAEAFEMKYIKKRKR